MDPTLAQILTYLYELERRLAEALEEIARLQDAQPSAEE